MVPGGGAAWVGPALPGDGGSTGGPPRKRDQIQKGVDQTCKNSLPTRKVNSSASLYFGRVFTEWSEGNFAEMVLYCSQGQPSHMGGTPFARRINPGPPPFHGGEGGGGRKTYFVGGVAALPSPPTPTSPALPRPCPVLPLQCESLWELSDSYKVGANAPHTKAA